MKRFNSMAALRKLGNKNNSKTKKRTIIACVVVLIIGILYFSFARFESTTSFNLISGTANIQNISLIDKINKLKTNGSTELEYDGTTDNNLRYIGADPNNYVEFNGELWRIIGVMNNIEKEDGTTESLVKIRRAEAIGNYSWDTSASSINSGNGINQWGESGAYEGADLMIELNTDYFGNITVGTDGKWYNESNNSKTADKPTSTINQSSQDMIETVVWNLGSPSNDNGTYDSSYYKNVTPSTLYTRERAATNGKTCTSGTNCDTVTRTSTWTGKVGLIYPSDYGYSTSGYDAINRQITCLKTSLMYWSSNSICYSYSWIYKSSLNQWALSSGAGNTYSYTVYDVFNYGNISDSNASAPFAVFPVVFLKSSITITSGNGSSDRPYKLEYKPNITDTLTSLKSNGATDLEYDGISTLGEYGTADNNLRYVGANPSNYIYYNCSTTEPSEMNDSTCEKWRIIGVFNNVENENENKGSRVKIIRDEDLGGYYAWNSCPYAINSGRGSNQWGESTYTDGSVYEGSYLMLELNTDYLGNITIGTDGKWYSTDSMAKDTMPTTSLNEEAQRMIQVAKWNTGTYSSSTRLNDILYGQLYNIERSNIVSYNADDIVRTTSWIGKVALPYPSDFAYATSGTDSVSRSECLSYSVSSWTCSSSNWLSYNYNYWTITPAYNYDNSLFREAFRVTYYKSIQTDGTHMANKIRPALYLKGDVYILDGDGSSTNPYKIGI